MKIKKAILASSILLTATPAWALDMEYYTYGGYSAIVLAFQKIALIFSDAGYNALFFVVIVAGMFLGVASWLMAASTGRKAAPLSWAPPILLGVGIYLALVVPKGTLTIYDPLMNRFQTVNGIPNGIVMVAGSLNKIEQGLVDIIDTSGNVEGYKRTGGGLGFNMLYQATKGGLGLGNTYIGSSLRRYAKDCVLFEMIRPGTTLTSESLAKDSTNALNQFALAASPAVWTVYYDDTNPAGETMSCQAAWSSINSYLSDTANLQSIVTQECSAMGFNTSNATELARCRENLSDFTSYLYGGTLSVAPEALFRQIGMMEALDDVLKSENPDMALRAMSNRSIMTSGISMGLVANDWLPIMRAVFTSVAVGLIPFIVLFIPTGIVGKASGLICGFFVWLTCWGITDTILHGIATDYAVQAMDYIKANNLGYNAIMMYPSYMEKALSMFGFVRTAGIMLATIMTGMLISFGGHALAMMAGNIQSTIQSSAGMAGMAAADPIGGMQARQSIMSTAMQQGSMDAFDNQGKGRFSAARSIGEMGFERQHAGVLAQREHERLTGQGRMEALTNQAFHGTSGTFSNGLFNSTIDQGGAGRMDQGAAGRLQYDRAGNLVAAQGATVNMSDMAKYRSSVATSAVEKLASQVSRSASQSEAIGHLQSMGFSERDARGFTESIKGNASWGRDSKSTDQTVTDNAYTKGVDSSLGIKGSTGPIGVGVSTKGNVSETEKHVSTNAADKSLSIGYSKDWNTMRDHVSSTYFSNDTTRNKMESYASSQGWSDVKESAHQYSQMKMLESSASQNVLHKAVEQIGNEKFSYIADTNMRNYRSLQYIESLGAGGHFGGPTHDQITKKLDLSKDNIMDFGASMPKGPSGGNIHFKSGGNATADSVASHLKTAAQGAGYSGKVTSLPGDGGIR